MGHPSVRANCAQARRATFPGRIINRRESEAAVVAGSVPLYLYIGHHIDGYRMECVSRPQHYSF